MAEYPLDPQLAKMVVASPEFRWHSARLTFFRPGHPPSCSDVAGCSMSLVVQSQTCSALA